MSFRSSGAVLLLITAKLALGADTCGPTIKTTGSIQTVTNTQNATPTIDYITYDMITTITHSCYTHVVETPWTPTGTVSTSTKGCGAQADCIVEAIETVYVPPHDPCCMTTETISTPSPSPTCNKGCQTAIIGTTTITTDATPLPPNTDGSNVPSSVLSLIVGRAGTPTMPDDAPVSTAAPKCTMTFKTILPLNLGPVKTEHANVSVSSVTLSGCAGCEVVTMNIGGAGPVAVFTTTSTDTEVSTSTSYVCEPSSI